MTLSDVIGAMRAAGCSESQIGSAVVNLTERGRKPNAERQAKFRSRNAERNALQSRITVTAEKPEIAEPPRARVDSNLLTIDISGKEGRKKDRLTPTKILLECLSPEMTSHVMDHRRAIKHPLTELAARGLVRDLRARGDPDENARQMIERGWRGFNHDWLTNGHRNGNHYGDYLERHSAGAEAKRQVASDRIIELFARDGPKICSGSLKQLPER